jgi:hypothetical protein
MHFGDIVREILTASCGRDLRSASQGTPLPGLDSPATLRTLAANLELAFGIEVGEHDLVHFRTVRDVLQCVRLRRWERRAGSEDGAAGPAVAGARVPRPVFRSPSSDPRERFIRYTPPPPASPPAAAPARSTKRI